MSIGTDIHAYHVIPRVIKLLVFNQACRNKKDSKIKAYRKKLNYK